MLSSSSIWLDILINDLQKGVKKWVLVFLIISIVLIYPSYLLGTWLSTSWLNMPFNTFGLKKENIVNLKTFQAEDVTDLKDVSFVNLSGDKTLVYGFVDNRANQTVGYNPFIFKKQVLGKEGEILYETIERSYLLPGDIKYISATVDNGDANSISIQLMDSSKLVDYNYDANPLLRRPEMQVLDSRVESIEGDDNIRLRTSIKNPNNFVIGKIDFFLLVRDSQDSVVGVQEYSLTRMLPNETRDIALTYPAPKNRIPELLDVRYSVNYLDESSITLR